MNNINAMQQTSAPYSRIKSYRHQNGAVFATTLLVLVVLLVSSILGLNAVGNSTLQTQIARNMQQKQMSFQFSEAAGGVGEVNYQQQVSACLEGLGACTIDFSPEYRGENPHSAAFWNGAQVVEANGKQYGQRVAEYLGFRLSPGDTRRMHFYRITSRGYDRALSGGAVSADVSATSITQTIVMICSNEDGSSCD